MELLNYSGFHLASVCFIKIVIKIIEKEKKQLKYSAMLLYMINVNEFWKLIINSKAFIVEKTWYLVFLYTKKKKLLTWILASSCSIDV